jgi:hypothetical protein
VPGAFGEATSEVTSHVLPMHTGCTEQGDVRSSRIWGIVGLYQREDCQSSKPIPISLFRFFFFFLECLFIVRER